VFEELAKSKQKVFEEQMKTHAEADADGEDGESSGGDSEKAEEADPILVIQPVKVISSDLVGDAAKASLFSDEALFSGANGANVEKGLASGA